MRRAGIHPAAWITWATCAGLVAFVTTDPLYLLLLIVVSWFVHAAHRNEGPTGRAFRIFLSAAVVAVVLRTGLVLIGTVNASNVAYAFLEGLRLGTVLVVFGTFNAVTDPFGLVRMAPRRFHEPALAAALALSIAPRTVATVASVREAQRLRGSPVRGLRALPSLAVPVLERGMDDAGSLAESMDARGHGRGPRSRYRPQPWGAGAVAMTAAAVVAAGLFVSASIVGWAPLQTATSPIGWPQTDPVLVIALALLAVPGFIRRGGDR